MKLTDEQLNALGIAGARLAADEPVAHPSSDAAEGYAVSAVLLTVLQLQATSFQRAGELRAVRAPETERVGIELAVDPHNNVLQARSSDGSPLQIRNAPADHVMSDPAGEDIMYLDKLDQPVLVMRESGGAAVVAHDGSQFHSYPVAAVSVEPLATVDAPLAEVAATCDDPWLREQLEPLAREGDRWSLAVGMGMAWRLYESPQKGLARQQVAQLLAGKVVPELATTARWARGLSGAQAATLRDLSVAEVDRLHDELDELRRDPDVASQRWRERLLEFLHARDDLDNLLVVLREAGADAKLRVALESLDEAGSALLAGLPRGLELADERLRRAGLAPHAWWAQVD